MYIFLDWKSVKEANSHIDFLPKCLNFKKIIKNHDFLLVHPLNIILNQKLVYNMPAYVQRRIYGIYFLGKNTFSPKLTMLTTKCTLSFSIGNNET